MVIVTGGYQGGLLLDTEILDLAVGEWQPGPKLPIGKYKSALLKDFNKITHWLLLALKVSATHNNTMKIGFSQIKYWLGSTMG